MNTQQSMDFFCLCANANLYIEGRMPPVDLFRKNNCKIVLGTDSYSSNWQLSIAKEMEAVQKYFPHIPIETILQWATNNGAKALGWEDDLGNIKNGKKSAVTLIDNGLASSRRLI